MPSITIHDLSHSRELDRHAMSDVRGGNSSLANAGSYANVNVAVNTNENIVQYQNVEVNALNNVGVIGAGFGPLRFNVSPSQYATTGSAIAF
ncbi:hypothetical protein [Burkholderia sp. S171]|uniref:hypothetical protein n=1 Tax=Burkholderia sp. S171 TaxID=1641860 RepID=UPI00131B9781|nr:hypothetical protein [Burkholderia sp. S171]